VKILITGASGFIGQHLVNQLITNEEYQLVLPLRNTTNNQWDHHKIKIISLQDFATASKEYWEETLKEISVVIHLAAVTSSTSNESCHNINVIGTRNLLDGIKSSKSVSRLIYLSSIKVNGETTEKNKPFTESSPTDPSDSYAISKSVAENTIKEALRGTHIDWVIIRPPLVYGPNSSGNLNLLKNIISKKIPLPFGSIKNKRSMISVESLVKLIDICIEHPNAQNQLFLASDAYSPSTKELIEHIGNQIGIKTYLIPIPAWLLLFLLTIIGKKSIASRLIHSLEIDSSKAKKELQWDAPFCPNKLTS
jgi:UDP-4-keto-D-QuiNAc 4-reductase